MSDFELTALASFVMAAVSSAIALISLLFNSNTSRELKRMEADLNDSNAERNARRDYRYEALKRLYTDYEPIRFHLAEACESARGYIAELSQRANSPERFPTGSLPDGNYRKLATIYHLLAPSAYFKIVQRELTLVDLEMSRSAMLQYLIAKHIFLLFTRDAEIANICKLDYTPYVNEWRIRRVENPLRYRRQGFVLGRLENAINSIIVQRENNVAGVIGFGEFETLMKNVPENDFSSPLGAAADLFADFEQSQRPILWRILIAQLMLYDLLIFAIRMDVSTLAAIEEHLASAECFLRALGIADAESSEIVAFVQTEIVRSIRESFVPV